MFVNRRTKRTALGVSIRLLILATAAVASSCLLLDDPLYSRTTDVLSRRWFTAIAGTPMWHGAPAVVDGVVIVGVRGGIAGFDLETGEQRWNATLFRTPPSNPGATTIPVSQH